MTAENSYREILRSTAIIGGSSVFKILIGLLRIKAVALILGPTGLGLIGILNNLMAVASTVSSLGFNNIGTRQIAEATGHGDQAAIGAARRALFWGTLLLALMGGIFVWILRHVLAGKVLGDAELAPIVGWLAIGVMLSVASSSQIALLNGMRRIGDIARVNIFSSILSTSLGVALIWHFREDGLLWFVLSLPVATFIMGHLFVAHLPKVQSERTPLPVLVRQWRTLASLGSAFMVAGLAAPVGQLMVRGLVQQELGSVSLGYYEASWGISMNYLGLVLMAMGQDYYPRLTAAITDHTKVNQLVNEQTEAALLIAGPLLIGMMAVAPWVMIILYSDEFVQASRILRWQLFGDILKIASWPLGYIILAAGDGKNHILAQSGWLLVFPLVTWVGLPYVGIEATGISFLVMYLVYLPLIYILARRRTGFRWSPEVNNNMLLLASTAILVGIVGSWNVWLGATVGLLAATALGLMALLRLVKMASIGGPLGRLTAVARRYFFKLR